LCRRVDILTIILICNHHGKEKGSEEGGEKESRKETRLVRKEKSPANIYEVVAGDFSFGGIGI